MSKKIIAIYEEALERIRNMNPAEILPDDVIKIADNALTEAENTPDVDRDVLIADLRDFIMSRGLIFNAAEEISDALNKDGAIKTMRGKPWSKASVARLMPMVRDAIIAATAKPELIVAQPVEEPIVIETTKGPAPVEAAPAPVEEVIVAGSDDGLDDLESLLDEVVVA